MISLDSAMFLKADIHFQIAPLYEAGFWHDGRMPAEISAHS